jgi:hypothetical protein
MISKKNIPGCIGNMSREIGRLCKKYSVKGLKKKTYVKSVI